MDKFDTNIFINCPFDEEYQKDMLKPMIYFIVKIGFNPRLAIETSDSGQTRLNKIVQIINECKYSIHDLSKIKSTEKDEYARMNMPFELGVDYGIRVKDLSQKKFLILGAEDYDYQKALSDISGFDIKVHKNNPQILFDRLYQWASETLSIEKQKPPLQIFYDYTDFWTQIFERKKSEFNSDKVAKNHQENITIPEFIREIKSIGL